MFIVTYRWKIAAGGEKEFRAAFEELAQLYMQLRGQLDSRLAQRDDGVWVGTATWPDRDTYLLAHERGVPDPAVANRMNSLVKERLDPEFREID